MDFFLAGSPGTILNKIILSGGGARVPGLGPLMEEKNAIPVEMVNPFVEVKCNPSTFDPEYLSANAPYFGVAVGLATRKVGDR